MPPGEGGSHVKVFFFFGVVQHHVIQYKPMQMSLQNQESGASIFPHVHGGG